MAVILSAVEIATLLAELVAKKNEQRRGNLTRMRVSERSMRDIFHRTRTTPELFDQVQEILLQSGWCLFWTGTCFAVVAADIAESWPLVSSKRIDDQLKQVRARNYDFVTRGKKLLSERYIATKRSREENEMQLPSVEAGDD